MTQSGSELDNVLFEARLLILISTSNSSVFILRAERRQRTRNEEKYWNDQYYFNGRVESLPTVYRARIVVTNNSKTDVLTTLLWRRPASRHCSLHKAARPDSCWVFTRYLHSAANKRWMLNNHLQLQPSTVVILVMGGESFTATGHNTAQPSRHPAVRGNITSTISYFTAKVCAKICA